jgi:hypothetical protein
MHHTPIRSFEKTEVRACLTNIDEHDNVLISQLFAPLEVGHKLDAPAKAHSFVNLSVVANSWQDFPASPVEKFSCFV